MELARRATAGAGLGGHLQGSKRDHSIDIEDEIAEKRDKLIDGLQRRMSQKTSATALFTIRWEVV